MTTQTSEDVAGGSGSGPATAGAAGPARPDAAVLSGALPTEARNPLSLDIDLWPTEAILELLHSEDRAAVASVQSAIPALASAVDLGVAALSQGGSIHYFGAGTSGRLAVLDAAELQPTYGVSDDLVVAHVAGGVAALVTARENVEDDERLGAVETAHLGPPDLVVGLTASGRTPYVGGALRGARAVGARTVLVTANPEAPLAEHADVLVVCDTGAEVVVGSTRMKAGTAQKLVLNSFSTAVMIRSGRTYSNLMDHMRTTNAKLRARAVTVLAMASGLDRHDCATVLADADGEVPTALVVLLAGVPTAVARQALADCGGVVRRTLRALSEHESAGSRSGVDAAEL